MAGEKIEAGEALAMGLIDRIVSPETLMDAARALAGDVLVAKPGHAAAIKGMVG
jgi:enoyl-CoA hydratase/carnithine racemase